jgi:hypothetical protein
MKAAFGAPDAHCKVTRPRRNVWYGSASVSEARHPATPNRRSDGAFDAGVVPASVGRVITLHEPEAAPDSGQLPMSCVYPILTGLRRLVATRASMTDDNCITETT